MDLKMFDQSVKNLLDTRNFSVGTIPCSHKDNLRIRNALRYLSLVLLDTKMFVPALSRHFSMANIKSFLLNLPDDISILVDTLKKLLETLHSFDREGYLPAPRDFWLEISQEEKNRGASIIKLYSSLINCVLNTKDWLAYYHLNTCLCFITRLTLKDISEQDDAAEDKYLAIETVTSNHTYMYDDCYDLAREVGAMLLHFHPQGILPRHGNGATSSTRRSACSITKCITVLKDPRYADLISLDCINQVYEWQSAEVESLPPFGQLAKCREYSQPENNLPLLTMVPKGLDKKRPTVRENIVNQYFQLGLQDAFRDYLTHDMCGIDLSDQEYSRNLTLKANREHTYATIDLSSASDCVTWRLVRYVFGMCRPDLLEVMAAIRSDTIVTHKGEHVLSMAFTAGSGLCFPIESIIFSGIVSVAMRRKYGRIRNYAVYGDDIIVPADIYNDVVELLQSFGFIPNVDKSYPGHSLFHESCGIECWSGHDVTPLRISRRWDICSRYVSPESFHESRIDFCNQCFLHGYLSLRKILLSEMDMHYFHETKGLLSFSYENSHLKSRMVMHADSGNAYQRTELLRATISTSKKYIYKNTSEEYYHSLWKNRERQPVHVLVDGLVNPWERDFSVHPRLGTRWMPSN